MSSTTTIDPHRVAERRRELGLTEKELAHRLGVRLSQIEQIENGRLEAEPFREQLERELGSIAERSLAPDEQTPAEVIEAEQVAEGVEAGPRWGVPMIIGTVIVLVVIRLFTEIVPVLPRFFNVIDVPIFLFFVVAAISRGYSRLRVGPDWLWKVAGVLVLVIAIAAVANPTRIEIGPALLFAYGILAPIAIYSATYLLWTPGNSRRVTSMIVALGVLQLVVVLTLQLPGFIASSDPNPDNISGTFGENAYQLVFFLIVFIATLMAIFIRESGRFSGRLSQILIPAALAVILLAQYRALLISTVITLLLAAAILNVLRGRTVVTVIVGGVALVVALGVISSNFPILKFQETLKLNPVELAEQRIDALNSVDRLYGDEPRFMLTGTGPGTFSSRAWRTFSDAGSTSQSNVVGSYALSLTDGREYSTDVSRKYIEPELRTAVAVSGSTAVTSPLASYTSIAAEIGLLGLVIVLIIYGGMMVSLAVRTWRGIRELLGPRDPLGALLIASISALFLLIQMGLLENWLEVARLTFITWILVAIANRELDARATEGTDEA